MTINERLLALRTHMKINNLDAYLIPSSDPHQSEYVAEHWKSRVWISGFTGSAGIVAVTMDHAGLWTDSRYFLQAEDDLKDSEFELHKQLVAHAPEHITWLTEHLSKDSRVGCDGSLFSVGQIRALNKSFYSKNIELDFRQDLMPSIWKNRPTLPLNQIFELDEKYAGESRASKLQTIQKEMTAVNADYHLVSTLDNIAWIFNIRSNDVECNPVAIAYAVIGLEGSYLFIEKSKVSAELVDGLRGDGVFIKPYDEIESFLKGVPADKKVLINPQTISIKLFNAIDEKQQITGSTISSMLKAKKNATEVGHIRKAMIKDGVALTKLYRWLDAELATGSVSEVDVSEKLNEYREQQGEYYGESFAAIVGYKGNGAIVHYRAERETCAQLKKEGILLLDSGGQYIHGTTDITRTTALGEPTAEQKRNFTLVLKGHINLASIKFPRGTRGMQMDTLARMFLWQQGLDYGHGTGHGVGFFLNVHEPPQGFAATIAPRGTTVFEPGMFTSNEPGYYKEGEYGIRIENLVLCVEADAKESGGFLKFETLTLFPIDSRLIDRDLLTAAEIDWLNTYHAEVFTKVSPFLDDAEQAWMKEKCRAI